MRSTNLFFLAVLLAGGALLLWAPDAQAQTQNPPARCPLDVGLVLDRSGSMQSGGLDAAKAGSILFLNNLRITDDQSGVVSFSDAAALDKSMDFNHPESQRVILAMAALGNTNIQAAIDTSRADILANRRVGTRDVMVLLTDGTPTAGGDPRPSAAAAKAAGIELFVIGVGAGVSHALNMDLASDPDATYYHVAATAADVEGAYQDVLDLALDCRPLPDFTWGHACAGQPYPFTDVSRILFDPPVALVESRWDWGDGTTDTYNPWQANVQHVFPARGTYDVTLNVTDSTGRQNEVTHEIDVDACPVARFDCWGVAPPYLRIAFRDRSFDLDGDLVLWRWDLGPPGTRTGGGDFTADYPALATYNVTLYVEDSHGHNDTVTQPCRPLLNLPPVIDPHPVYYVYEDDDLFFVVTGRDRDSDVYYFYWDAGPLPGRARYDAADGAFHWRPRVGDRGVYQGVMFGISDYEFTDETLVTIVVLPVLQDPPPPQTDLDNDGVPDRHDVCPYNPNPEQAASEACRLPSRVPTSADEGPAGGVDDAEGANADGSDGADAMDGAGDASASGPGLLDPGDTVDTDRDGRSDERDNCPYLANPAQSDLDRDREGDACDADADGDLVPERDGLGRRLDNCPLRFNPDQTDTDRDGVGDACHGDAEAAGAPLPGSDLGGGDPAVQAAAGAPGAGAGAGPDGAARAAWLGAVALAFAALVAGPLALRRRRRG